MKFGHGLVDQGLGYFFQITRYRIDQTSRGDIVNLTRHPTGIVMNQRFCFGLKDFICAAGFFDTVIELGRCLSLWHRLHGKLQCDAL